MPERRLVATVRPKVEADLGFRICGKVAERCVDVDVGDRVAAGQVLARLDEADVRLQREQAAASAADRQRAATEGARGRMMRADRALGLLVGDAIVASLLPIIRKWLQQSHPAWIITASRPGRGRDRRRHAEGSAPGGADTRRLIAEAAERLFREVGYRKTTVADIAKALRMSPANVYRFFASKKAINEAVAERLLDGIGVALEAIAAAAGRPAPERMRDALSTMSRSSVALFTADRRMHEMVEAAMAESWEVVHRNIVRVEALLARVVADGMAAGAFRPGDPVTAARCASAALVRFCHPTVIVECEGEPGPTPEQMSDFILADLR